MMDEAKSNNQPSPDFPSHPATKNPIKKPPPEQRNLQQLFVMYMCPNASWLHENTNFWFHLLEGLYQNKWPAIFVWKESS